MALRYRGVWVQCADYASGDVAFESGELWKALSQNAGKRPSENNPNIWVKLTPEEKREIEDDIKGDPDAPKSLIDQSHDDLKDVRMLAQGEDAYHVTRAQAQGLAKANGLSADNPALTARDMPIMKKYLADFKKIITPDGFGMIYGCAWNDKDKTLCVAGDDKVGWYDDTTSTWKVQELTGEWRCVCVHGDICVVGGTNRAAAGTPGELQYVSVRAGEYNSIASSGGRVIMVGDGKVAWSETGTAAWLGIDTNRGYGDGIIYDERRAVFVAVGPSGARTTETGQIWKREDDFIARGTWRDIARGDGVTAACSGAIAYRTDASGEWEKRDTESGGWEGVAVGGGFIVAVKNGSSIVADSDDPVFNEKAVPDYIYTCAVYGGSRFWIAGSAVATAKIVDTAAALASADDPNEDNPFLTKSGFETRFEAVRLSLIEQVEKLVAESRLKWKDVN